MTTFPTLSARSCLGVVWAIVLCLGAGNGSASGQAAARPSVKAPPLTLHAHIFENQPAVEALALVYPLLSDVGTVELKPKENTLVIRDTLASINRIVPVLSRFDHPQRQIRLDVRIVSAQADTFSPPARSRLPKEHVDRLRTMLPYHSYEQLAGTMLEAGEGERVQYQLGNRFSLDFRLGTLVEGARVRLHEFQVFRGARDQGEKQRLIVTTLFLHLNQPVYLGLAPSEDSKEALMVVVTAQVAAEPEAEDATARKDTGGDKP